MAVERAHGGYGYGSVGSEASPEKFTQESCGGGTQAPGCCLSQSPSEGKQCEQLGSIPSPIIDAPHMSSAEPEQLGSTPSPIIDAPRMSMFGTESCRTMDRDRDRTLHMCMCVRRPVCVVPQNTPHPHCAWDLSRRLRLGDLTVPGFTFMGAKPSNFLPGAPSARSQSNF